MWLKNNQDIYAADTKRHWSMKSRSSGAGGVSLGTALTRIHKFIIMAFCLMMTDFLPNFKCARRTNLPRMIIILKDWELSKVQIENYQKRIKTKRQQRQLYIPTCLSFVRIWKLSKNGAPSAVDCSRLGSTLSVWRRERQEKHSLYCEYLLRVSRHLQWPCNQV